MLFDPLPCHKLSHLPPERDVLYGRPPRVQKEYIKESTEKQEIVKSFQRCRNTELFLVAKLLNNEHSISRDMITGSPGTLVSDQRVSGNLYLHVGFKS